MPDGSSGEGCGPETRSPPHHKGDFIMLYSTPPTTQHLFAGDTLNGVEDTARACLDRWLAQVEAPEPVGKMIESLIYLAQIEFNGPEAMVSMKHYNNEIAGILKDLIDLTNKLQWELEAGETETQ
jgi:hypothetical protein